MITDESLLSSDNFTCHVTYVIPLLSRRTAILVFHCLGLGLRVCPCVYMSLYVCRHRCYISMIMTCVQFLEGASLYNRKSSIMTITSLSDVGLCHFMVIMETVIVGIHGEYCVAVTCCGVVGYFLSSSFTCDIALIGSEEHLISTNPLRSIQMSSCCLSGMKRVSDVFLSTSTSYTYSRTCM